MKKHVYEIKFLTDLRELKDAYQKGIINMNISHIARTLGK